MTITAANTNMITFLSFLVLLDAEHIPRMRLSLRLFDMQVPYKTVRYLIALEYLIFWYLKQKFLLNCRPQQLTQLSSPLQPTKIHHNHSVSSFLHSALNSIL